MFVLLENVRFMVVLCSFHSLRGLVLPLLTSIDVGFCHAWLSTRVFVLLENMRFIVVSYSFQVLCKGGGCQFIGDAPLPLIGYEEF